MMLFLSVSEKFWEISIFEDKENTMPRNVGFDYPLTQRHIPEERNSQYTAAKTSQFFLASTRLLILFVTSFRKYPSVSSFFSDDIMNRIISLTNFNAHFFIH